MSSAVRALAVPDLRLEIGGNVLPPAVHDAVVSVDVDQTTNRANNFRFQIWDVPVEGRYSYVEDQRFDLGRDVRLFLGYTGELREVAVGRIRSLHTEYSRDGLLLTVEGSDDAYEFLMAPADARVYRNRRDSEIAAEIAGEAGLAAAVDPTDTVAASKTKTAGTSYFDFLTGLAARNGFLLQIAGRELRFRGYPADSEPELVLRWERDVVALETTTSTWNTVSDVHVRGWDQERKREIVGLAPAGSESPRIGSGESGSEITKRLYDGVRTVSVDRAVQSVAEAEGLAVSLLNRASSTLVRGVARIVGEPRAVTGSIVALAGFDARTDGPYFVEQAAHRLDRTGYYTTLHLQRNTL